MKKMTQSFRCAITIAAIFVVSAFAALSFTSCDDIDDDYTIHYSMGFDTFSSTSTIDDMTEEMDLVTNTFLTYLNVTSEQFTLTGTSDACDEIVVSVCDVAAANLDIQSFSSSFTYVVNNDTTGETIFTYSR